MTKKKIKIQLTLEIDEDRYNPVYKGLQTDEIKEMIINRVEDNGAFKGQEIHISRYGFYAMRVNGDHDFLVNYNKDELVVMPEDCLVTHQNPVWNHACNGCVYLGTDYRVNPKGKASAHDMYYCTEEGDEKIVVRYGDNTGEFISSGEDTSKVLHTETGDCRDSTGILRVALGWAVKYKLTK